MYVFDKRKLGRVMATGITYKKSQRSFIHVKTLALARSKSFNLTCITRALYPKVSN